MHTRAVGIRKTHTAEHEDLCRRVRYLFNFGQSRWHMNFSFSARAKWLNDFLRNEPADSTLRMTRMSHLLQNTIDSTRFTWQRARHVSYRYIPGEGQRATKGALAHRLGANWLAD